MTLGVISHMHQQPADGRGPMLPAHSATVFQRNRINGPNPTLASRQRQNQLPKKIATCRPWIHLRLLRAHLLSVQIFSFGIGNSRSRLLAM